MDRVTHACHAEGVVHSLKGWTHHELGAIDVDSIDIVWEVAFKKSLRPVFKRINMFLKEYIHISIIDLIEGVKIKFACSF